MVVKKSDVEHLQKLLEAIKDPYPRFVEGIMGLMGYLTDEQFFEFIKWIAEDPDLSTDDIVERTESTIVGNGK